MNQNKLETLINLFESKEIRKENLRDNVTDIEIALTNIGEIVRINFLSTFNFL